MTGRYPLLVLGLGNTLCEDDGAGVVAVERLRAMFDVPDGVYLLDGGTLGLALLPWLQDADRIVIIDAILAEGPPGTLVRLEDADVVRAAGQRMSVHQIGVVDLLSGVTLTGHVPEVLVLHGVVPGGMALSVDLTPAVEAAIPDLIDAVLDEVAALGFPFSRRVVAA